MLPCVTDASLPGLPTRIETLTFTGVTWVEVAVGVATCVPVAGPVAPAAAVAVEVFVWWTGPFSPGLSTRTVALMFAGSTCVEVAVAVAESCEADEVGVGAIVTVGIGLVSSAVSSGLVSTTVVPPLPSSVPGSISTVTPVACGSSGLVSPVTPVACGSESVFPAVLVPELPPVWASPHCPLTYEADGLVFESVGDWPSGEAVVAVEPSPFAQDPLPVVPPGGELATGIVSPEVESACEGAGATLPGAEFASVAAPPDARAV
jgi:hypothetical protein